MSGIVPSISQFLAPGASGLRLVLLAGAAVAGYLSFTAGAIAAVPPPTPVALGANTTGITEDTSVALENFAARAGVMPKIVMYYQDWNEGWSTALLNPRIIDPILAQGAVPMITWEPLLDTKNPVEQPEYAPTRIAAGVYDSYIRRAAREAAAFGRPFFLALCTRDERILVSVGSKRRWQHTRRLHCDVATRRINFPRRRSYERFAGCGRRMFIPLGTGGLSHSRHTIQVTRGSMTSRWMAITGGPRSRRVGRASRRSLDRATRRSPLLQPSR